MRLLVGDDGDECTEEEGELCGPVRIELMDLRSLRRRAGLRGVEVSALSSKLPKTSMSVDGIPGSGRDGGLGGRSFEVLMP